jgi:hypothetical protein
MDDREAYEYYAKPENQVPAGPGRKRRKPPMTAVLSVRFDPAVLATVERLAGAFGVSVSDWIRAAVCREEYRQRVKYLDEHRHELEVVPGSGRRGEAKALPSSLSLLPARTLSCPHLSMGGVISASCGTCGPLRAVA